MNEDLIQSLDSQAFIDQFGLPFAGYDNPVRFVDDNFGFSAVKEYPNGYASLIKIFISKDVLATRNHILPLTITASYGKKLNGGITLSSSSEKIRTLFDPIELVSINEFVYDAQLKRFFYNGWIIKNQEIDARSLLEKIDRLHRKPTRPFRGLWLRIKIVFWYVIVVSILKGVSKILLGLLYISSGIKLSQDIWSRIVLRDRIRDEERKSTAFAEKKTIEFFGYKASAWAIIFYGTIHLALFIVFFYCGFMPRLVTAIFSNSFLTICYVVATLSFVDGVLPRVLKLLVRIVDDAFHWAAYKRIKI